MKIIKVFIVSGIRNRETVVHDLLALWHKKFPHIPGFSKESVEKVRLSNCESASAILKDVSAQINMYNHLDRKQILVVYEGEYTSTLCNYLTTQTLDLCLLTEGLIKTFKSFKNPSRAELFPWILSGEIMRHIRQ